LDFQRLFVIHQANAFFVTRPFPCQLHGCVMRTNTGRLPRLKLARSDGMAWGRAPISGTPV
jgi:hypothetical protein